MKKTIDNINTIISKSLPKKKHLLLHNLSEAVIIRESEDRILPAIVGENGECDINLFDDCYDAGFYHKLNSISYSEVSGWGDSQDKVSVHDMSIVCYGKRSVFDPYKLERSVCEAISKATSNGSICTPVSSDFNRFQVFSAEFTGYPFFLQPDVFLFKVNYRITTTKITC